MWPKARLLRIPADHRKSRIGEPTEEAGADRAEPSVRHVRAAELGRCAWAAAVASPGGGLSGLPAGRTAVATLTTLVRAGGQVQLLAGRRHGRESSDQANAGKLYRSRPRTANLRTVSSGAA
jgi:hypothetical protein